MICRIATLAAIALIGLFLFTGTGVDAKTKKPVAYENVTATIIPFPSTSADVVGRVS